jgi:thiol-disulfide isomerase/thioredoxin
MLCYNIMTRRPVYRSFAFVLAVSFMPALCLAKDSPSFTMLVPENAGNTITLDYFRGRPLLVAFWRSDCAPCTQERPILNAIASAHPDLQVALVSLDGDVYKQRHFPVPSASNIKVLEAEGDAEKTLRQMGDARAALPFSVFLHADGKTCDTHYGLLGTDRADEWVKGC